MPNFVSPGVYVIEKDLSDYPTSVNPSVVGLVGFADRGPMDKATLITNQNQLVREFGPPSEDIHGQALEGALEILESVNSLYMVRCGDGTEVEASAAISLGACPAVFIPSSVLTASAFNLNLNVSNNAGAAQYTQSKTYTITSSTNDLSSRMLTTIGGDFDGNKVSVVPSGNGVYIVGAYAGSGAAIEVSAGQTTGSGLSIVSYVDTDGLHTAPDISEFQVTGKGSTLDPANELHIESKYKGAGYNYGTATDGDLTGVSIDVDAVGGKHAFLRVQDEGSQVEDYKVTLVSGTSFFEDQILATDVDNKSEYIKGYIKLNGTNITAVGLADFAEPVAALDATVTSVIVTGPNSSNTLAKDTAGNPLFIKPIEGLYGLAGGDSGIPASTDTDGIADALIGDGTSEPKTGIQALDDDLLNISMAAVPGVSDQNVQNALVTLAEQTQNFLAVLSPPYSVGRVQDAIDWTNGLATSRTAALNSSYAAVYWPWVKTFSQFDGKDRWYDPAIFAIRQMGFTDEVADAWFAPAGFVRGRLTKPTDVEVRVGQGDRDAMYSGGNVVNPIVNFPQQGITIFGQRTTQRAATALDRVNVRRLMIVVRKSLLQSTRQFVFEPNDAVTWERITNTVEPLLDEIRRRRGITEFKVVCDETTNTPVRVDRNELWCKVLIKPTKSAEIIIFELNLTNQSASLN